MSRTFADDSKSYGCSCTTIVAWTALVIAVFAMTFAAIVFFNWTNGSLNSPTVVALERKIALLEQRLRLAAETTEKIAPLPPKAVITGITARATDEDVKSMGGNSATFVLTADSLRQYSMTSVEAPGNPTLMRLCCLAGQYQVCDGATQLHGNLGVQFMLLGAEGHLLVYANSRVMVGAKCTFSWW